jgi:hypothetical protein
VRTQPTKKSHKKRILLKAVHSETAKAHNKTPAVFSQLMENVQTERLAHKEDHVAADVVDKKAFFIFLFTFYPFENTRAKIF